MLTRFSSKVMSRIHFITCGANDNQKIKTIYMMVFISFYINVCIIKNMLDKGDCNDWSCWEIWRKAKV